METDRLKISTLLSFDLPMYVHRDRSLLLCPSHTGWSLTGWYKTVPSYSIRHQSHPQHFISKRSHEGLPWLGWDPHGGPLLCCGGGGGEAPHPLPHLVPAHVPSQCRHVRRGGQHVHLRPQGAGPFSGGGGGGEGPHPLPHLVPAHVPSQCRHVRRVGQHVRLHPQGAGPFSGGGGGEGPHPFAR